MSERRPADSTAPSDRPPDTEPRAEIEPPTDPEGGAAPRATDEIYERGLRVRRAVLGSAHVERALGEAGELDRDFQEYITRAAWGEVWARPGLPQKTRHLLTLAMLAALDRQDELALHVRATARTGVTLPELREVLLQVAVYAGVPAANAAFRTARRVLAEMTPERGEGE